MRPGAGGRLAWPSFAIVALLSLVAMALNITRSAPGLQRDDLIALTPVLLFGVIGALVASRLPGNRIGWLLLAFAAVNVLAFFLEEYAIHGLLTNPGSLPGARGAAWVVGWAADWVPPALVALLFLFFPDGKLPSRRWRLVVALSLVMVLFGSISNAFFPGAITSAKGIDNPLGAPSLNNLLIVLNRGASALIPVVLGLSAASLFFRSRRATGEQRQQIKWFAYAAVLLAAEILIANALNAFGLAGGEWIGFAVFLVALSTLPGAMGVAILKYRLYDIDRIINKTLVYGVVTVLLALGYAGAVILAQAILPVTDDSPAIVAITTLAVVALFRPLRSRVQGFIDRRFYRRRYDAARTIESFGSRLRQETDLDSLQTELLTLVEQTMQPVHASLWLRSGLER